MALNYPYPQYQQNNTINWVQGEAAAKAWLVAPGGSTILLDSEQPIFYMKAVDQAGMPSLRKFKYEEITVAPQAGNFVTREELERAKEDIEKRLAELSPKKVKKVDEA